MSKQCSDKTPPQWIELLSTLHNDEILQQAALLPPTEVLAHIFLRVLYLIYGHI